LAKKLPFPPERTGRLHPFLPDFVIQAGCVFLSFRNPVMQLKKAFNWAQND